MKHLNSLLFILLLTLYSIAANKSVRSQKPNIVYLLADDMGIGDLGCYNSESKIPTPAMDALAKEGIMFLDAHTNSAVCSPTRYGTLTGCYAFRTSLKSGVLWGSSPVLIEKGTETVASLLKKNGYNTACIGKWHLGLNWQTKVEGVVLTDNCKPIFQKSILQNLYFLVRMKLVSIIFMAFRLLLICPRISLSKTTIHRAYPKQ